jgi:aminopeptidase N
MKRFFPAVLLVVTACFTCFTANTSIASTASVGTAPFNFDATPGALSKYVVPLRTRVEFDLDPYGAEFSGVVTHTLDIRKATKLIQLHASGLELSDARLNDTSTLAIRSDAKMHLAGFESANEIPPGTHQLRINFKGKLTANGYGLYYAQYRASDGKDKRMLATQMEPIGAREMLPCFDEPAFRTVWEVAITAEPKYTVLGNMPVASESIRDGKRRTEFAPTPSMSSYLLAIAVGELEKTTERFEGIDLSIYTVAGRHQNTRYAMESTKKILSYFKDYFGSAYPLPKLDQIAVPGKRGAMENWGLITYSESLLSVDEATASAESKYWSFNVIAHELAHQWFGNLVTMAWWDGLWLNESFAEWMGHKAAAALNPSWSVARRNSTSKETAMADDALIASAPIQRAVASDRDAENLFDSITYSKGKSVLGMIERQASEEKLRDGLRAYFTKHAYSNTTSADLWAALSKSTGGDVQRFADAWTHQAGFPLIDVQLLCRAGKQTLRLSQQRYALKPGYVPAQSWNIALLVSRPGEKTMAPESVFLSTVAQRMDAGKCGDAVLVDAGANGYFRIRYDSAATKALAKHQFELSVADRIRLLRDAWALAEIGATSPMLALSQIRSLRNEDSSEVWLEAITVLSRAQVLLRGDPAQKIIDRFARPLLARRLAALGWQPRANDGDVDHSLRAELIAALGRYGDEAVLREAHQRFDQLRSGSLVDGNVANGSLRAIGPRATKTDVERMVVLYVAGKHPTLERALLFSLASVNDEKLLRYVLSLSLSGDVPRTLSRGIVSAVAEIGLNNEVAWQFTKANLDELLKRGSRYGWRYLIPAALANGRDMRMAAEVKALATARLEEGERLETLRSVASVERNAWAYQAIRSKLKPF